MGSTASTQKAKGHQVQPVKQIFKSIGKENIDLSPRKKSINGTPKLKHLHSPNLLKSPLIRSSERILDAFSMNEKQCGQSSAQNSEISEQDQQQIQNQFRPRKVSRFQEKRFVVESANQKEQIASSSSKNIFVLQPKEVQTSRSIQTFDSRLNLKLNFENNNLDDHNQSQQWKDFEMNYNHNEGDNHSKLSNNDTHKGNTDRSISMNNIFNHLSQLNKKPSQPKQKGDSNLFSNEADIFFRKREFPKEDEKNQSQGPNSVPGTQINNTLHTGQAPEGNNQKHNNNKSDSLQNRQSNQQSSNLQDQEVESNKEQEFDGNNFKHEVIQIAKHKGNKDFFKKGNIYLLVQDENSTLQKKLSKNDSETIIADLITNNISVTDFLVSDKCDIEEQILINKQKKKIQIQQQQQIEQASKVQKPKRSYKVMYGNQAASASVPTIDSQIFDNIPTKNGSAHSMSNLQMQEQQNIIISYNQEWEEIRNKSAIQSSVK